MFSNILKRLRNSPDPGSVTVELNAIKIQNPDFDPQVHAERVQRWQANNSDEKFRTNYDCLNPESIVLDLGGYHGDYAFRMNGQYGATCHVFEVIPELCKKISEDPRANQKILVHPFGLAGESRQEKLFLAEEGSSTFLDRSIEQRQITIELVKAANWFEREIPGRMVDLVKINIEGGEYELLEHLIDVGLANQIRNIQVQFHEDVIPDASKRMADIQSQLARTHRLTYQEKFIWENWELNS